MAIFRRNKQQPVEERAATLASLQAFADRSGLTTAGVVVDPDRAIRLSAVWAAIELIAGVGSSMPLDEFRSVAGQQQQLPLSTVFADPDPDPSVSAVAFRAQMLRSAATRGNAYAQVLGVETGRPTGLVSIHPDRVSWKWEKVNDLWQWSVYVDGQRRERWPMGDLFHFALFQQPGSPVGLSPVEYHKQSIGAALAAQRFGQQFFDGGGNPSIILRPPVRLSPDEARALKQQVTDVTRGTREPLVMPREIEIEKMSVPAEDSQFLETQRYGVEEIARVFLGGFPELIGGSVSGSAITYANREQRNADFISLSLAPRYLIPFEQALSTLVPTGRYVKHNVDALLRSDLAARYASYKTSAEVSAIMGAPLLTINDMRRLENMAPIEGGDTMPSNGDATARELSPAEALQKIYLAVGSVITTDEARQIVSTMTGIDLQTPAPSSLTAQPAPAARMAHEAAEQRDARIIEALRHITSRQEPAQVTVNMPEIQLRESDALPRAIEALAPAFSEQRQLAADQLEAIRLLAETMPAPVVNVTTPDVTVNVQPADVQVNVPDQPAPVVNVQASDVQPTIVVQPADVPATRKRVIYDRQGRVSEVVEEQN